MCSDVKSISTLVVYNRHTDGLNGLTSGKESDAGEPAYFTQSGIRRSCSLDGVALASRCHGDDDVGCRRGGVGRMRNDSSDDDWHSQGEVDSMSFHWLVR